MGIEELKLVLETVQGVSNSAVWVICLYFSVGIIKTVLVTGSMLTAFWWVVGLIRRGIAESSLASEMLTVLGERHPDDYYHRSQLLRNLARKYEERTVT